MERSPTWSPEGTRMLEQLVAGARASSGSNDPATDQRCDWQPLCTIYGSGDILGTAGDDIICGSDGADRISAGGGNDCVLGLGGNDQISAGAGNDSGRPPDRPSGGRQPRGGPDSLRTWRSPSPAGTARSPDA